MKKISYQSHRNFLAPPDMSRLQLISDEPVCRIFIYHTCPLVDPAQMRLCLSFFNLFLFIFLYRGCKGPETLWKLKWKLCNPFAEQGDTNVNSEYDQVDLSSARGTSRPPRSQIMSNFPGSSTGHTAGSIQRQGSLEQRGFPRTQGVTYIEEKQNHLPTVPEPEDFVREVVHRLQAVKTQLKLK
jgi:hypothetical protein